MPTSAFNIADSCGARKSQSSKRTVLPISAKLAASIAFPLLVVVLYWARASRDPVLQLGWLCFAFGAFYGYTLAETVNLTAGNFVWRPTGNRHDAWSPDGCLLIAFFLKPNKFLEGPLAGTLLE